MYWKMIREKSVMMGIEQMEMVVMQTADYNLLCLKDVLETIEMKMVFLMHAMRAYTFIILSKVIRMVMESAMCVIIVLMIQTPGKKRLMGIIILEMFVLTLRKK